MSPFGADLMATLNAKKLVSDIAKGHGYLADEDLRSLGENRFKVEEALSNAHRMSGLSVITNARFVFELLQNADDNHYEKARESGTAPFVSYKIFPDKIVLECNEDGFSPENLKAICAIGQSSKTGAQGYIGEKGIGFKSVFMVAWKVHIHSNYFSFTFTHKKGDSGMGMISPVWEETTEELKSPLTRITLYLYEAGDEAERIRGSIQSQFEDFQANMLLFFKNIRKIQVAFYDDKGQQSSSETYSIAQPIPGHATLTKIKTTGMTTESEDRHFRVVRHVAKNLPRNENRTYSESEESTRAYSTSEVVLAFPVSDSSVPIIEPQEIFAFLPVRPVGFNFLIQADFVTDANRQDIQTFSLRNSGLRDAIADAFVAAVKQICDHSILRYTWVRYLPRQKTFSSSSFWRDLVTQIEQKMKKVPVFYDHKGFGGRLMTDLVRATADIVGEDGKPLLDDGDRAKIISQLYGARYLTVLQEYGLRLASFVDVVIWLKADLVNGDSSRMKSQDTAKPWHDQVAKLINRILAEGGAWSIQQVMQMDLLPLSDGTWVPASSGPIYFPHFDGLNIPDDIGLKLLLRPVDDSERTALFRALGIKTASLQMIRKAIADRNRNPEAQQKSLSVHQSNCHLQFMYLTDHLDKERLISARFFRIFDQHGRLRSRVSHTVYLTTTDPFGPSAVFKKTPSGPNPGDGAPGHDALFVSDSYFGGLLGGHGPIQPGGQKESWRTWFARELLVQTHVDFRVPHSSQTLMADARYIQTYRPDKFMECLVRWYQAQDSEKLEHEIECLPKTKVLCRGNHFLPLEATYFPIQRLEARTSRLLIDDAFFPWLWLEGDAIHEEIPPKWKGLLSKLNVGRPKSDLEFALAILEYSSKGFSPSIKSASVARLFELYKHIQTQFTENTDRVTAAGLIRYVKFKPNV
ncbi:hypothetical protein COL5a_003750 [Colletotrichum fioriniae]|nr:hypothetical protein COL5a_003750 [Colletotrichum fioriniae]